MNSVLCPNNVSVDVRVVALTFREPFKIAYEEVTSCEVVFVTIRDADGNVGVGCASPDVEVTGEDVAGVFAHLHGNLSRDFFDIPFDNWYGYHVKIQSVFANLPSAQAAVEEAVLNLWSQRHNISLHHVWGGLRDSCNIMITVGIKDCEETVTDVRRRLREGFKTIKIKCGLDMEGDIDRLQAVRNVLPHDIAIVLDANQGYSVVEAERVCAAARTLSVSLLEQPVASDDLEGMLWLHRNAGVPIIADEMVVSVDDAVRLMRSDNVAGVNIKLMKCGGPINFLKIFHEGVRLGKIVMIGCMYESNVSITTGAHLALALPIQFVDLDSGRLDFDDDPALGGAHVEGGAIRIHTPATVRWADYHESK